MMGAFAELARTEASYRTRRGLPDDARWLAAAQLLGVDLNLLSGEAGHA